MDEHEHEHESGELQPYAPPQMSEVTDEDRLAELRRERDHRDMLGAFEFLASKADELPELRRKLDDAQWRSIVGFAAQVQATQRALREAEICPKLFAHNGAQSPCRPRTDGLCCWCGRPV